MNNNTQHHDNSHYVAEEVPKYATEEEILASFGYKQV